MVGFLPDVPAPRIPYDRNGSTGTMISSTNVVTSISSANLIAMNNEDQAGMGSLIVDSKQCIIFPTLHDLYGSLLVTAGSTMGVQEVSTNTTNGLDGTWTQFRATHNPFNITIPNYRTGVYMAPSPALGVKAWRIVNGINSNTIFTLHLYGKPSANTDRLEMWHPTLDQPLSDTPAYFDWGDVQRGASVLTKSFRLKNLSASLTASTITVGAEALTDASPTYVSQTAFNYDGGAYAGTASLGSLGPGAISQVFNVRLTTTTSSALGVWSQRYYANAASWA